MFLDTALRANGLDPEKDVEIVNQRMAEAVTSFVSGAVPAVALWVPFDVTVREKVAERRRSWSMRPAYYPKAAIVGGWVARNDYVEKNQATLAASSAAGRRPTTICWPIGQGRSRHLQSKHYPQVEPAAFAEQFKASKYFTSSEWRKLYADGTTTRWLQQVTDFFVNAGGIQNPVPASQVLRSEDLSRDDQGVGPSLR